MTSRIPVAVVTGAGSGVGRAVAHRLAREGWNVVLLGRRRDALEESIALAPRGLRRRFTVRPLDIAEGEAVRRLAAELTQGRGRVAAVIAAAGTNIPRRSWSELAPEDYRQVLATNLDGAYHCVQAFLPAMRKQGGGSFVFINSEAGLRASAKSGVAYVASKFGLTGLAQSLNAEERAHGIRACSIFPGDIDTPLLEKRPLRPPAAARKRMLQPEDVADCVWLALSLPSRASIEELTLRPA